MNEQTTRSVGAHGVPREMRIVVWGINYAPEVTGIAPYNVMLCRFLQAQGHEVEMVTTFAYYPMWAKRPEDAGRWGRTDLVDGIRVHRCWHYVPRKVAAWKRILHEGSFVGTSLLRICAMRRPDVLVVVSPPLLLGVAAWMAGTLKSAPFVFHVQDLQPDAAVGLGMLKPGIFTRALYRIEAFAYRTAARVSGISAGMLDAFRRKGVDGEKCVYFPNPVILPKLADLPSRGGFRRRHGWGEDDFLAIYSGNLGVKQGLGILIEAAALCVDPRVRIVICGDGAERVALADRVAKRRLENVVLLPLQPGAEYAEMLADAEVCLITQQAGSGQSFFPSKLLAALSFEKPVLSVADADSELARALQQGKFGINVLPGDAAALARALAEMAGEPAALRRMGERGREYVGQFEAGRVLKGFEEVLREVVQKL